MKSAITAMEALLVCAIATGQAVVGTLPRCHKDSSSFSWTDSVGYPGGHQLAITAGRVFRTPIPRRSAVPSGAPLRRVTVATLGVA